jgi:hypothetical protein
MTTNLPEQPRPLNQASTREQSFSGLDFFFEREQPKSSGRRIFLLVVLLVALGTAGWWTYANYLGAMESRKADTATSNAGETPAATPSPKPATQAAASSPAPDAGSSQVVVPSDATAKPEALPVTSTPTLTPNTTAGDKSAAKHAPSAPPVKASKAPEPAPADTGDSDFRKGEAYLYGRGVHENCDEAMKYLRAASAKSSAKARSALGAMYNTGHCVQRDLPTSYLWFAMALRVDPKNQILEKDLTAVWNQMTPPERQQAARMKQ